MSILKGILHHWNKTTKSYDTIHPETEVAQITNWNQGIVNTLASTALGTLVNTLTSDSLLATMIQKVLPATGVKYNMAQNGYICLGSLFGGLIIQWVTNKDMNITWPIAFTLCYAAVVCSINNGSEYGYRGAIIPTATGCTSRYVRNARNGDPDYLTELNYIAIGIISR